MTESFRIPDHAVTAGLAVILAVIAAGLVFDCLPQLSLGVIAVPLILVMVMYPKRGLILLLVVQSALEITQLDVVTFYLGPMRVRLDEVLFWWIMLLWLLALPDRKARVATGATPRFIMLLVGIAVLSLVWGVAAGNDPGHAAIMFKNYPGYLSFFPAAWLISRDRETADHLILAIIAGGVLGGINIIARGYLRVDETVYERGTGLRVQSRQAFAIGVALLFLLTRILSLRNRTNLKIIIPAGVLMMTGIILSQTRSLWYGIILGAVVILILYTLSGNRKTWVVLRKILGLTLLVGVFFIVTMSVVNSFGFLETEDVLKRTESETGNYLTDATFLARALSWLEILKEVNNPAGLVLGKGMGYEITYFRVDYMQRMTWSFVDSSYFQILLNAGIPGVLALILLFGHGTVKAAVLAGRERDPGREAMLLAICGSFVMLASGSVFMSAITNYRFTVLYGVLFALLAVKPGHGTVSADLPGKA